VTRDEHYKRLNSYRNSREYIAYARKIGIDTTETVAEYKKTGELPSLLGVRWSIDERIYNEFLNMLPPMNWRGSSFMMREFVFGTITTKYSHVGDRAYCEFVDAKECT